MFETLSKNLTENGFTVRCFAAAAEAAAYLDDALEGKTIGFGGSMTLEEMGLYERLSRRNDVR